MKPVTFCIPMASRAGPANWLAINRDLGYALRSILRQTDPRFSVLVACHDRPVCEEMHDPRVEFVPVTGPRPAGPHQFIADKVRKRRAIAAVLRERDPCYVVNHDADDILHRRLVEYVRATDDPHGYTYPRGYVLDMTRLNLAPTEAVWKGPFSNVCGSSAILWLTPDDYVAPPGEERSYFERFRQHALWAETAREAGRPLREVGFHCCIYAQNSGHNISVGLQRDEERVRNLMREVERNAVAWTPEIATDFSLDWVWPARSVRSATPRRPEVLPPAPDDARARLGVYGTNVQRLDLARALSPEAAVAADQRAAVSRALTGVAIDALARLSPSHVLEAGAHEASFSRRAKERLPDARVVALEANPEVHAQHAAGLSGAGVEYLHRCAAASGGVAAFHVPIRHRQVKPTLGSTLMDPRADDHLRYDVPSVRLDELPAAQGERCAIRISVKGAIGPVLDGAEGLLPRCVALFAEMEAEAHWPDGILAGEVIVRLGRHGLFPLVADIRREWQFNALFLRKNAFHLVQDAPAQLAATLRP